SVFPGAEGWHTPGRLGGHGRLVILNGSGWGPGAIVGAEQRAWPGESAMTAADPGEVAGRAIHVSETLTSAMAADRNAGHAALAPRTAHYRSLGGTAVRLLR